MSGETHVTLCMANDQRPRVSVSLYPDAAARFQANLQSSGVPLLKIAHGDTEVVFWPHDVRNVTRSDIDAARRLVEAATAYLDICERIHADSAT
jgi:hypothetical protein